MKKIIKTILIVSCLVVLPFIFAKPARAGLVYDILNSNGFTGLTSIQKTFGIVNFQPNTKTYTPMAPIPGVTAVGVAINLASGGLSGFLKNLFNLVLAVAAAASVLMIVYGGFLYATTDAIIGKQDGFKIIKNAFIGLGLALVSWLLLYTINPNLVTLKVLDMTPGSVSGGGDSPTTLSFLSSQTREEFSQIQADNNDISKTKTDLETTKKDIADKQQQIKDIQDKLAKMPSNEGDTGASSALMREQSQLEAEITSLETKEAGLSTQLTTQVTNFANSGKAATLTDAQIQYVVVGKNTQNGTAIFNEDANGNLIFNSNNSQGEVFGGVSTYNKAVNKVEEQKNMIVSVQTNNLKNSGLTGAELTTATEKVTISANSEALMSEAKINTARYQYDNTATAAQVIQYRNNVSNSYDKNIAQLTALGLTEQASQMKTDKIVRLNSLADVASSKNK
ncbi:MAG: hypothetical protein WCF94_01430 [bacterium]